MNHLLVHFGFQRSHVSINDITMLHLFRINQEISIYYLDLIELDQTYILDLEKRFFEEIQFVPPLI